jgi:hypothetical protein
MLVVAAELNLLVELLLRVLGLLYKVEMLVLKVTGAALVAAVAAILVVAQVQTQTLALVVVVALPTSTHLLLLLQL